MFLINLSLKFTVVYLLIVGVDSQGLLAANYTMALLQKCIYGAYSFDSFVTEKRLQSQLLETTTSHSPVCIHMNSYKINHAI